MNKKECETSNWQDLGYEDGREDRPLDFAEKRSNACHKYDISMDRAGYDRGRDLGHRDYCTVSHFYFLGESALVAQPQKCPADMQEKLSLAHANGRELNRLRNRRTEIKKEIEDAAKDRSVIADLGRVAAALSGRSATWEMDERLHEVEDEIAKMEASAPDNAEFCDREMKQKKVIGQFTPGFLLQLSPQMQGDLESCSRSSTGSIQQ